MITLSGGSTRTHLGPQRKAFSGRASSVMPRHLAGERVRDGFMSAMKPELRRKAGSVSTAGTQMAAERYMKTKGSSSHTGRNAAVGSAVLAAGYGGYKAYQHRGDIKAGASKVVNSFHTSRQHHGNVD